MDNQPLVIKTERDDVLLRQCTESDIPAFLTLVACNAERINWSIKQHRVIEMLLPRSTGSMSLGVWLKSEPIGYVYLSPLPAPYHAEVGYWLDVHHVGCGYATMTLRALVAHAFDTLEYWRLTALVLDDNTKSRNVLKRTGFRQVALAADVHTYAIQANEWSP